MHLPAYLVVNVNENTLEIMSWICRFFFFNKKLIFRPFKRHRNHKKCQKLKVPRKSRNWNILTADQNQNKRLRVKDRLT